MIELMDLGFQIYEETWKLQKALVEKRIKDEIPDTLILVEHDPVFTLGRNRDWSNLLFPSDQLLKEGFKLYKIERGGDITYHGPGQLVGYPIFRIENALAGVKGFVYKIEEVLTRVLGGYGINAFRHNKYTGVFTEKGKIASIGVAFKKWVSFHGFSLNVNNDLKPFTYINPCGITDIPMTSMKECLSKEVDFGELKGKVYQKFLDVFEYDSQNDEN
ncbi:MAG TPA: lipoyl(octanoyl) transferase LipB [Candidatus Hydrothermia bacterium]|nr:lipoyl(octanoyl) transferase LipB [Candidatus Hydrothermae bacterium]MDD3649335.1 lipoyl(octanoyl) transferase LipB [Candidatus Hydrothermia bacterium]MDD5572569.1 lipoyl(octanoyl) transferase LipB [Candidatus Hydrothermia bacterium]HOK22750.1 lipoyl(octanoyl) transferase LipB [Candidatus Hydrothermia bacterium]HOL23459.1 lipoyl(octanoyl) transferase LipB [Candidatus Hydrothermia bacterium]